MPPRFLLTPEEAAQALGRSKLYELLRAGAVERSHAGTAWEDHGPVFANTLGRPLHPRNFLLRDFYPLLKRAGLPRMRFHTSSTR
jgi:hypothetical protein